MDELTDGIVVDLYGRHTGQATTDVVVEDVSPQTDGSSYHFKGTGQINIAVTGPFAQLVGFSASLFVRPDASSNGGTLIRRERSFELALSPESSGYRVRLTAFVGGETRSVESATVIAPENWSEIHAGFESGTMHLMVNGVEVSQTLPILDSGDGDLTVGQGFLGYLDDLRLFHSSGTSPPLLEFENGQDDIEIVLDDSGSAVFFANSTGQMSVVPPDPFSLDPTDRDTAIQHWIRSSWIVKWRIEVEEGLPPIPDQTIATLPSISLAILLRLTEALFAGSSGETDATILLHDVLIGFAPIAPVAVFVTIRDVVFAVERVLDGRGTFFDKLTIVLSLTTLLAGSAILVRAKKAKKLVNALQRIRRAGTATLRMARWLTRAARDPVVRQRLATTLEVLSEQSDEIAEATANVLEVADVGWKHADEFEATLKSADNVGEVVEELNTIKRTDGVDTLRRVVAGAGACALGSAPQISSSSTLMLSAASAEPFCRVVKAGVKARLRAVKAGVKESRLKQMAENFKERTWQVLSDVEDMVDDFVDQNGIKKLFNQLGTKPGRNTYIADGAAGVIRYGKKKARELGRKVSALEQGRPISGTRYRRDYDLTFSDVPGMVDDLDIDVKTYTTFSKSSKMFKKVGRSGKPGKEAWKVQRDIIIQRNRSDYGAFRWAFPRALEHRKADIIEWMLDQFDSPLVMKRIPDETARKNSKNLFEAALRRAIGGVLEFSDEL
jgi:hypothetical protein